MKGIGSNIKKARERLGLRQNELAAKVGVTPSAIANYEANTSHPKEPILYKLIEALQVDANYLFMNVVNQNKDEPTDWYDPLIDAYQEAADPTQENVCKLLDIDHVRPGVAPEPKHENITYDGLELPATIDKVVYDYPAAAGQPLYATDEFERIDFPIDSVPIDADFGVRISGRSMEPGIMDGDIVWVYETQTLTDGEVGVFMIDEDEAVCKRVKLKPHGKIDRLASDNEDEPDIYPKDIDFEIKVVGKVVGTFTE